MMNNSLFNKRQLIPTCLMLSLLICSHISCYLLWKTRAGVATDSPRRGGKGKWQVLAAVSAVFAKSQSFPPGTWLSLKQTRKELMSALIRTQLNIDGELQSVAFVPKSEGGIIAAPHSRAPVWNLHELQLLTKRPHKAQENPSLHSALVPLTSTGADRPINNEMHANIIACGHGDTFGT